MIPEALIQRLASAERVSVLTGAGVSAESGVPTYRDWNTGLWKQYGPEDLATARGFKRNPKTVWEWYTWRRNLIAETHPNSGHIAFAEMEQLFPGFQLITQNVDGLHQRAGSQKVIELHGNISRTKCFDENTPVDHWTEDGQVPPSCPRCGGMLRPDVVWFEEAMPVVELRQAVAATECEVFIVAGTSSLVYPAGELPIEARRQGATVVEVNTTMTDISQEVHFHVSGPSGVIMPALVEAIRGARGPKK